MNRKSNVLQKHDFNRLFLETIIKGTMIKGEHILTVTNEGV